MYSIEEFDKTKTKILKYIMYKKRTENEIRIKFNTIDEDLLEDSIEYLKEAGYINDKNYIERAEGKRSFCSFCSVLFLACFRLFPSLAQYLYDNHCIPNAVTKPLLNFFVNLLD